MAYPYWDSMEERPDGSRRAGLNSTLILFTVIFCASILCLIISPTLLVSVKLLCCLPVAQFVIMVFLFVRARMQHQSETVKGLWLGVLLSLGLDGMLGFAYFYIIAVMTDGFRWNLAH